MGASCSGASTTAAGVGGTLLGGAAGEGASEGVDALLGVARSGDDDLTAAASSGVEHFASSDLGAGVLWMTETLAGALAGAVTSGGYSLSSARVRTWCGRAPYGTSPPRMEEMKRRGGADGLPGLGARFRSGLRSENQRRPATPTQRISISTGSQQK